MAFDLAELNGKWLNIIQEFTNYSVPTKRNVPCPFCGGDDRFTYTNKHGNGTWLCRKCTPNGSDGIGFISRKTGFDRAETFKRIVSRYQYESPKQDIVEIAFDDNFKRSNVLSGWDGRTLKNKDKQYKFKYIWNWLDHNGEWFGYVVRMEFYSRKDQENKKIVWQVHHGAFEDNPDETGWYQVSVQPKPLFGYMTKLRAELPIIFCEGEKTQRDLYRLLRDINYYCNVLCTQGGASQINCSDFFPVKHCKEIYIWPDLDDTGFQHARNITSVLPQAKIFTRKSLEALGLKEKQDASDLETLSLLQFEELKNHAINIRNQ